MDKMVKKIGVALCLLCMLAANTFVLNAAEPEQRVLNTVTKRALVMSAPYTDHVSSLTTQGFASAISRWCPSSNVTVFSNNALGHSNATFLQEITTVLGNADEDDLSYVYIHCHGDEYTGSLSINGLNQQVLSLSTLKNTLDTIDGKIVLFIDACYSGLAIEPFTRGQNITIEQKMINDFFGEETRSGEFAGSSKYTVFCSCSWYEGAAAVNIQNQSIGLGTYCWAYALGYNINSNVNLSNFPADTNLDNIITKNELHDYAQALIDYFYATHSEMQEEQHFASYSLNTMNSPFYQNYRLGDVDQDNQIDMADILSIRKYLANMISFTTYQVKLADCDGNGSVNMADTLEIQKFLAGVPTP